MQMRLAYIRPTVRLRRERQEALVAKYEPTLIWYAGEHTPDDVAKMMRKAGRTLILPTLDTIAPRREVRNEAIGAVLSSGSTIIEAATDTTLGPDCRDAVMAALRAKQRDLSHEDAKRAGEAGGERGYDFDVRKRAAEMWQTSATNAEIQAALGVHPVTVYRWCVTERKAIGLPPLKRGRGPGRY